MIRSESALNLPALKDEESLIQSSVVANCRMNRERDLLGTNGYDSEIGFDPLEFLLEAARRDRVVRWLDLCCGSGKALVQAAIQFANRGQGESLSMMGVDLVDAFVKTEVPDSVQFVTAALSKWSTNEQFQLITCVHGLHYVGDKLGLISRAAKWLTKNGTLVANFDAASVRYENGKPANRLVSRLLRESVAKYNSRRKLLTIQGQRAISFPLEFIGVEDTCGPNYTGQPAVNGWYRRSN